MNHPVADTVRARMLSEARCNEIGPRTVGAVLITPTLRATVLIEQIPFWQAHPVYRLLTLVLLPMPCPREWDIAFVCCTTEAEVLDTYHRLEHERHLAVIHNLAVFGTELRPEDADA